MDIFMDTFYGHVNLMVVSCLTKYMRFNRLCLHVLIQPGLTVFIGITTRSIRVSWYLTSSQTHNNLFVGIYKILLLRQYEH